MNEVYSGVITKNNTDGFGWVMKIDDSTTFTEAVRVATNMAKILNANIFYEYQGVKARAWHNYTYQMNGAAYLTYKGTRLLDG